MNIVFRSTARAVRAVTSLSGLNQWSRSMCSASEAQKNLAEMVKKDKVVVFMKGTPAQPMCGFSNAVVQILRMHGVDNYAAYNVLDDQDLRQGQLRSSDLLLQARSHSYRPVRLPVGNWYHLLLH